MLKQYITQKIHLSNSNVSHKKNEILDYFIKTYELFEKLFDIFSDDEVYYMQPEPLRHQIIFYYGHTAVFFINKLLLGNYIKNRINEEFEAIFSVGVDEMSWDDLNKSHYKWPTVQQTKEYRVKVKEIIIAYIQNCEFTLPITWESPMWPILMGIEHEKIHIETSSVLHRQLNIKHIKPNSFGNECKEYGIHPKNELIQIPAYTVNLGINKNNPYYGWDNEYGNYQEEVAPFKASKYLVSNGEFLEFVNDNGYINNTYWSKEGISWKAYKKSLFPMFWIKNGDNYKYRTLTNIIDLPLNWPVDTNYLEAEAFCKWKSEKTNKKITLPSEAMWHSVLEFAKTTDNICNIKEHKANINLEYYSSSCPIDRFKTGEFYDVIGNVWQWTNTTINGFKGFEVHPLYDDFSVPTFDDRHNIFKGGSWISTGNLTSTKSRYAFRKHFYQHAGFRYVEIQHEKKEVFNNNKKKYLDTTNKQHYINAASFAIQHSFNKNRALNLGCCFGIASLELAQEFNEVIGVDFTARNILNAQTLKIENNIKNCQFWQGDSCNLKPHLTGFDLILATNNLEEIYDINNFVTTITNRLNSNGVFILQNIHNKKSNTITSLLDNTFTKINHNVWKK